MENLGEAEAVNDLINAVDAELKAFKEQRLKEYRKNYYAKPVNKQRRDNYSKQYQQRLKSKILQ